LSYLVLRRYPVDQAYILRHSTEKLEL